MTIKASDIFHEKLTGGGFRLSVNYDGRLISCRYFEQSLRDAKRIFISEIKAGQFNKRV